MLPIKRPAFAMLAVLLGTPAMAADNPASHQHGHAELQLAFNGDEVDLLLISPAGNMLGFEHHPRTPEQKQAADTLTDWLEETPLINTPGSTCTVYGSTVQHEIAGGSPQGDDDHANEGQHADIEVTQILICPGLEKTGVLTTQLTTRFPGLEHLDIAWAGPGGQGATRLAHGENSFRLGR